MNKNIIRSWNKVVTPEDNVIIMGVIGKGSFEEMKEVISSLNGIKICTSKHLNNNFTKKEWKEIGLRHFWLVSMFNVLPEGEVLYASGKIKNLDLCKKAYNLIVVDSDNKIDGLIGDSILSVDAEKWGYSPINTNELFTIYKNMKEFESMESTETRSDIKEEGEE